MIGEAYFRLLGGTNGFHAKAENERFSAVGLGCRQNPKHENFNSSFGRLRQKNCSKKRRVARATRLFLSIQPIKLLICGVVVNAIIIS